MTGNTGRRHGGRNRGTIVRRPRGAPMTAGRASFMTRVGELVSQDAEESNRRSSAAGVLNQPVKVPPPPAVEPATKCYACDAPVVGIADRRHSPEGVWVQACARHSETTIAELWHRGAA